MNSILHSFNTHIHTPHHALKLRNQEYDLPLNLEAFSKLYRCLFALLPFFNNRESCSNVNFHSAFKQTTQTIQTSTCNLWWNTNQKSLLLLLFRWCSISQIFFANEMSVCWPSTYDQKLVNLIRFWLFFASLFVYFLLSPIQKATDERCLRMVSQM